MKLNEEELQEAMELVDRLMRNNQLIIWGDKPEGIMVCMSNEDIDSVCLNGPAVQIGINPKKYLLRRRQMEDVLIDEWTDEELVKMTEKSVLIATKIVNNIYEKYIDRDDVQPEAIMNALFLHGIVSCSSSGFSSKQEMLDDVEEMFE